MMYKTRRAHQCSRLERLRCDESDYVPTQTNTSLNRPLPSRSRTYCCHGCLETVLNEIPGSCAACSCHQEGALHAQNPGPGEQVTQTGRPAATLLQRQAHAFCKGRCSSAELYNACKSLCCRDKVTHGSRQQVEGKCSYPLLRFGRCQPPQLAGQCVTPCIQVRVVVVCRRARAGTSLYGVAHPTHFVPQGRVPAAARMSLRNTHTLQ